MTTADNTTKTITNAERRKQLFDALKTAGVKAKKSGKRGVAVDDRTVATIYDAANGSLRAFVVAKPKLPAKLAKQFTLTKTRGYAKRFTVEDDLTPLVEAIDYVSSTVESDEKSESKKTTPRKRTPSKSQREKSDAVVAETVAKLKSEQREIAAEKSAS